MFSICLGWKTKQNCQKDQKYVKIGGLNIPNIKNYMITLKLIWIKEKN